ncbi:MAG: hypothetical protein OEW15_10235 [Nitrospirota bacterium]|nr:hypothetical protein [Nitrospirota bacterium]
MYRKVIISLFVIVLLLSGCTRETEEGKIKKVISSIQAAAESKRILAVLEHLSKDYRDPQGNDYEGIKGLLSFYFFKHQAVHVYIPAIDIAVTGYTATAAFDAVLTGRPADGSGGTIIPESLGVYRFDVSLKREGDQWKVLSAKWELSGEGGPVPPPAR